MAEFQIGMTAPCAQMRSGSFGEIALQRGLLSIGSAGRVVPDRLEGEGLDPRGRPDNRVSPVEYDDRRGVIDAQGVGPYSSGCWGALGGRDRRTAPAIDLDRLDVVESFAGRGVAEVVEGRSRARRGAGFGRAQRVLGPWDSGVAGERFRRCYAVDCHGEFGSVTRGRPPRGAVRAGGL